MVDGRPITLPPIIIRASDTVQLPDGTSMTVGHATEFEGVWADQYRGDDVINTRNFTYEEYEEYRRQHPEYGLPEKRRPKVRAPGTNGNGNTLGRVVGEAGASNKPASDSNPEIEPETDAEADTGNGVLDGIQVGLDVVGLIPVVGEVADLANAGISLARGDFVGAGLSLVSAIPFVGWFGAGAKAGRRVSQVVEGAGKTVKQTPKPKPPKPPRNRKEGGRGRGRRKLKCGEYGRYGDLKRKPGGGKFDRDHVPSKEALLRRARQLNRGKPLTRGQERAITGWGNSVAIPRQAHRDVSPTYGGRNKSLASGDAKDLAGAARRDVEAMLRQIDKYDADGGCRRAYQRAAGRILRMNNKDFDAALKGLLSRK